jgi:FKBP-type peptidyl-prolyl cis-trans isomerase
MPAKAILSLTLVLACASSTVPAPESPRTIEPAEPAAPPPDPPPSTEPVQPLEPLPVAEAAPPARDPKAPADLTAPPADAERAPSGLVSKVLQPGTGSDRPRPDDIVTVNYTGWMADSGVKFDSSDDRGRAVEFALPKMVKGFSEGLQQMVVGEKRRLWIPGKLAYGDAPRKFGNPYGTLVFDIELVAVRHPPEAPVVPTDLNSPPGDARKTSSGLIYKVLRPGTGKVHPKARSTVEVHYSGWTLDGKMFDSSVQRGETATFPLNGVIRGWTEGVQLMVVGEKARFWIPSKLAYGDNPSGGTPSGTLVFDIELVSIRD